MNKLILIFLLCYFPDVLWTQQPVPDKPRVLISTDIGGTDPDDNQSMIHLLMYTDLFDLEGLVSSPSYGDGNTEEILKSIDLYEKDLPRLKAHQKGFASPEYLRSITKQGRHGGAPYKGYTTATEGSDWIIKCAQKQSERPLWVLVWGGLEDLAQALHDKPEIQDKIKVYWIGGPNKKWSANSYAYIVENFPNLWFIEANAVYRGLFLDQNAPDNLKNKNFFKHFIKDAGNLGKDFGNYYKGNIKMGDTPSLLYLMDGDPTDPMAESWGGSFEKVTHSPRYIFKRNTTLNDTIKVYSLVEYLFKGPILEIPADSACFTMSVYAGVGEQKWPGYYLGNGNYAIRYAPKKAEILKYEISSEIQGFPKQKGQLVVNNIWPGDRTAHDYQLGINWYTDPADLKLFEDGWQGAKTIQKWRSDVLRDWAKRWNWLR
ncbi:nucleoside hydrolase-like domain-containing protein [Flexithrix dorotheae]|uniref:nucleoside hydrolase-like domain-containing protein n=1 Tax=Flexithrix dorotheae TaxID=70993 RepID=UPI000369A278|nr:nucleoside hydrolase-like domain-containing protein [Flexithrix dorotheae]